MNHRDGIGAYGLAWVEADPSRRADLLERAWAPDAVYCDPLSTHIGQTQQELAGGHVEVTGEAVRHHDSAHFPWAVRDAGGATVLTRFDVCQLDGEGRITRLTGLFDA